MGWPKSSFGTSSQDGGIGRHACLLTQQQKELQLDLKTNKTQNYQEIKLNGSPTTKDLKKPCLSRQVGEAEMRRDTERQQQNGQSPIQVWWIKIRRDTLGASNCSPSQTA